MKQRNTVLLITQFMTVGGLERMVLNLARTLKQRDRWEPHVLSYDQLEGSVSLEAEFAALDIPFIQLRKPPGFSFRVVRKISSYCKQNQIRVIHTHDIGPLIYGSLAKLCPWNRLRLVHTQHSFIQLRQGEQNGKYDRWFARVADQLCTVSTPLKNKYEQLGVRTRRIQVVENGVPFPSKISLDRIGKHAKRKALISSVQNDPARSALERLQNSNWFLCMARVHPAKGQEHVIRVWSELKPEIRNQSTLILVGPETYPGHLENILKLIQEAPSSERIIYAGAALQPQLWLQASDLFISGSEFEGMPLAPIEAIGSGLPALLSSIPGHQILKDHAWLYPINDPKSGANAIQEILQDLVLPESGLKAKILSNSKTIHETYSIEKMASHYEGLYEVSPS